MEGAILKTQGTSQIPKMDLLPELVGLDSHHLRAWFSALAALCNHAGPGPSAGPSTQNLWAGARLGLIFLKALQVILKCNQGWNHCFKRKDYHRKIQQGTLTGYKWGAETPNNQVAAGVISVITVVIHIIITTAAMTSTDEQRIQVREERRTKRKCLRKVLYEDELTENIFKSPSFAELT